MQPIKRVSAWGLLMLATLLAAPAQACEICRKRDGIVEGAALVDETNHGGIISRDPCTGHE